MVSRMSKGTLAKWVRLLLISVVVLWCCQLGFSSMKCESNKYAYHEFNETYGWCCYVPNCDPGSEPSDCLETDEYLSKCIPCGNGKFMPTTTQFALPDGTMPKCKKFTTCDQKYAVIVFPGNATHDITCKCTDKIYSVYNYTDGNCYPSCEPGEHLENEDCHQCPKGTYKSTAGTGPCNNCSRCNHTVTECTSTQDAKCSPGPPEDSPATTDDKSWIAIPVLLILLAIVGGILIGVCLWYYRKHKSSLCSSICGTCYRSSSKKGSSNGENSSSQRDTVPLSSRNVNNEATHNGGNVTLNGETQDTPDQNNIQRDTDNEEQVSLC